MLNGCQPCVAHEFLGKGKTLNIANFREDDRHQYNPTALDRQQMLCRFEVFRHVFNFGQVLFPLGLKELDLVNIV